MSAGTRHLPSKASISDDDQAAREYVRAWEITASALEQERLAELRQPAETQTAQRFASLLTLPLPYPLRPGSGLVEQQRIFSRLRHTQS